MRTLRYRRLTQSVPPQIGFHSARSEHTDDSRIPALDGIRGVAILLVLLLHLAPFGHGLPAPTATIDKVFLAVARTGWIGVYLFFVLSGFLITGILVDSKGSAHYFRQFYARRVLRIFPLYYGALALFLVVLPALFPDQMTLRDLKADSLWYWSYTYNVKVAATGFKATSALGHMWSLAVEEQFYFLWPLVVWWLSRRRLIGACLFAIVGALVFRTVLAMMDRVVLINVLMPSAMDALAIGALIAIVKRQPGGLEKLRRWAKPVAFWSAIPMVGLFIAEAAGTITHRQLVVVGQSIIVVFFGALLSLALTTSPSTAFGKLASHPVLRFFGKYSYAIYVFHHPLLWFNPNALFRINFSGIPTVFGSRLPAYALWLVMMVGLTILMALVSWNLWEKQFLKLKHLFPYGEGSRTRPEQMPTPPLVSAAV